MAGGSGDTSQFAAGTFVVDSEKLYLGEYWTNRYIVAAETIAAAAQIAGLIVEIERAVHATPVLFTRVRTSDGIKDTDVYIISHVNAFGLRGINDTLLPLFNVARIDFNTAGNGRPSRKYLRGVLAEQDVNFNTITGGIVGLVNSSYADALATLPQYVDVDGEAITSGSLYPFVGMRQLRRGSKRKTPTTSPTPL